MDPSTDEEFAEDQAGFDGFPETDIVGDHQVDTGHFEGLQQWHELVVFDLDRSVEWRADRHAFEGAIGIWIEEWGQGIPSRCVEQGIELIGGHRGVGVAWQGGRFEEFAIWLTFPDQFFGEGELVIFVVESDHV